MTDTKICVFCNKELRNDPDPRTHRTIWVDPSGGDVCGWDGGNEPHWPREGDEAEFGIDSGEALARAIHNLPKTTTLTYIAYDDSLQPEQLAKIFESPEGMREVEEELDETFQESTWRAEDEYVKDACQDDFVADALESTGKRDWLVDEIRDRNDSWPLRDLLRNTNSQLMRYNLDAPGDPDNWATLEPNSWSWDDKQIDAAAWQLAKAARVIKREHRKHFRELVTEASGGGTLSVIWYGDVDTVYDALVADVDDKGNEVWKRGKRIFFTDPHFLVLDSWNGSGHSVQVKGVTVSYPFDPANIRVDAAKGHGYGWNDVAGVYQPAYTTNVKVEKGN